MAMSEKTPLLHDGMGNRGSSSSHRHGWSAKISNTVVGTIRVFISTVAAPGYYIVACFYDDNGQFSLTMPLVRVARQFSRKQHRKKKQAVATSKNQGKAETNVSELPKPTETEVDTQDEKADKPGSPPPAPALDSDLSDESKSRRSIRIKTINEDAVRKRRQRRSDKDSGTRKPTNINSPQTQLTAENIKSPINHSSTPRLTRYPRAPAPPRPLVPKRQPSYAVTNLSTPSSNQKTLIIDLDETLIHSMAKGGRMSTGHMVEVKLQSPVGVGGAVLGPQVPILYYVHKRPHCDEFLKKVSKWYNLIVFTASVQEYADPVIDWLELERKYFSARYYRQHCTFRNGAYIKDLSHVEPDLSKVMILDNSPMSYIFHEDNAIPIEGWISDPTDNDLIHIIPLLEGLQHLTDVRALLSLRLGEALPAS